VGEVATRPVPAATSPTSFAFGEAVRPDEGGGWYGHG
jgi:hypothetical protein